MQGNIFMEFYKLYKNGKHPFIAQATICSSMSGNKQGREKSSYTYFLMKGEEYF